jgi:hypothetical protein
MEGKQNEKAQIKNATNPKRILLLTNNNGYFSRTAASAAEASTWNELLPRKATNEDMMMDVSTTTTSCRLRSAGFAYDHNHFQISMPNPNTKSCSLQRSDSILCLGKFQELARPT